MNRNNIEIKVRKKSINELNIKYCSFHNHKKKRFLVKTATKIRATINEIKK